MGVRGFHIAVLLFFLSVCSTSACAQGYRTNLELIASIKDVPVSSEIYSDVANIKNLALLFLSFEEGDIRDADYNKFTDSVRKFLEEFTALYQQSRNGQPADHKESVRKALDLRGEAIYLESLSGTSLKLDDPIVVEIVDKEKQSIYRFLEDQADYFEDALEKEKAVPLKIEYLEYITLAYQGSGNSDKYELARAKLEEMNRMFDLHMDQAADYSSRAYEMKRNLKYEDEGLFALFSSYIRSRAVLRNYTYAMEIYQSNGISDTTLPRLPVTYADDYIELISQYSSAKALSSSILIAFFIVLLKILIPLVLVLAMFMIGFRDWQKDFIDTKLNTLIRRE